MPLGTILLSICADRRRFANACTRAALDNEEYLDELTKDLRSRYGDYHGRTVKPPLVPLPIAAKARFPGADAQSAVGAARETHRRYREQQGSCQGARAGDYGRKRTCIIREHYNLCRTSAKYCRRHQG